MSTKNNASIQAEAKAALLEILKPGDTVYTILRKVSSSGMSRDIDLCVIRDGNPRSITYWTARLCNSRTNPDNGAIRVGGCGMDMGFHLVYELSYNLFKDNFICIGESCPANDHSNGDRDYTPHLHSDSGYALKQSWL